MEFLRKLFKKETKNCIVKQYHITLSGFATQVEAFQIAEKICKELQIDKSNVFIKETFLEVSQAEYDKTLGKG